MGEARVVVGTYARSTVEVTRNRRYLPYIYVDNYI